MPEKQASRRGWKWFFWTAAAFNFLVGAAGMFVLDQTIDTRIIGVLVFAFGIVYAITARQPDKHADVLWAGVFGKVGVVSLLLADGLGGPDAAAMAFVVALDILFALGFLVFLLVRESNDE